LLILGLLLVCAACSKSPAPAPAAAETRTEPTSSGESAAFDASQLNALTQAVRKFAAERRQVPSSLDELVGQGYISPVPSPPPGKKFVTNKNLEVGLARQ